MSTAQSEQPSKSSTEMPPLLQGPSVWYGPEVQNSTEWLHELTSDDVAEIERAMRPLADAESDIAQITKADFPLPTLGPKLAGICSEVLEGRGFALLRGLPVDDWSIREAATAYFGLGCYFGNALSQNAMGHVLGHVRDLGRDAVHDPTSRVYQTRERQTFHTDYCDIVALLCLKTARSGGASALVSSMTIYNEMLKRRPDLVPALFGPSYTDWRGEIPEGGKPWHEVPVFNWHEEHLSVLYVRRYIESATRFPEVPPLTGERLEALDLFDELANDPALNMQMEFRPGDMQWVHNHTILHDRTAYEDWQEPERKRHLLRLWLAPPAARPLPPIYAQLYHGVDAGNRGGIVVPGTQLNAPLEPV